MLKNLKKVFTTILSICLILAVLDILIDNPYSQQLFSLYFNKLVSKHTKLSIHFESLSLNLVPLEVDFYGVRVQANSPKSEGATASATQVKVEISISSLFLGNPKIKWLHVDGLNLRIPHNFELDILKEPEKPQKHERPIEWPIKNIALENSSIFINLSSQEDQKNALIFTSISTQLKFKKLKELKGRVSVGAFTLISGNKTLIDRNEINTGIEVKGENIILNALHIKDPYFTALASGSGFLSFSNPKAPFLRLNTELDIDAELKILEKSLGWKKTQGKVKAHSRVFLNFPFQDPENIAIYAQGAFKTQDGYLSDIRIYDSDSQFILDNNGIKFFDTHVFIQNQEKASGEGSILFNNSVPFKFTAQTQALSLSQIISTFGPQFDAVDFNAYSNNVELEGTGSPFKMSLTAQAELANIAFPPLKIPITKYTRKPNCNANVNLSLTETGIDFKDSQALCFLPPDEYTVQSSQKNKLTLAPGSLFASKLEFRDRIDFNKGPQFKIIANNIDLSLAQSYFQKDLEGTGNITTSIVEVNGKVLISSQFSTKNLGFEKIIYPPLSGTMTIQDQRIEWQNVQSQQNDQDIYIASPHGSYNWVEDKLDFALKAQKLPKSFVRENLALFKLKNLMDLGFEVDNWEGMFKVPVDNLLQSEFSCTAQLQHVDYKNEEIFKHLAFSNKSSFGHFNFENISLNLGNLAAKGSIHYKKKSYDELFYSEDEVDLEFANEGEASKNVEFESFPVFKEFFEPLSIKGDISFHSKIKGPLKNLAGFFDGKLHNAQSHNYPLYPLEIKSFINQSQIQIFASQPGDNFIGRFDLDLSKKDLPFRSSASLRQYDIRPFSNFSFFKNDPRNYAYLSAQWNIEGYLTRFWEATGYLKLDELNMSIFPSNQFNVEPYKVKSSKPANILMTKKGWVFENNENFKANNPNFELELKLVNSHPPRNLGLHLDGVFNLADLPHFSSYFQSGSGKLFMESKIEGPMDKLKFTSHFYTDSPSKGKDNIINIAMMGLNPAFENVHLDMNYEEGAYTVRNLSARKGKGNLHVSGLIDPNGYRSTHLQINLDQTALDLELPYLKTLHTLLDGKLIITGRGRPYNLDGSLKILKAQTDSFLDLEGEILKEYSTHHGGPTFNENKKPLFHLNVGIEGNKSIEIKSRSLVTVLSSSVNVKGTNENPIVSGFLGIDRGRFRYKRDFIITHGEMIFDNPLRNDPKLNIVAKSQVNAYTVTIYISGDSSKPLVDLLVDPPTKDDGSAISRLDAIVLMSTGKLPETESRSQDTRGVVVSTGLNLYAAQLPFNKFNELTGQRFISPYVNYTTDEQGNPVPQLNVPIQLSEMIEAIIQTIPNRTSATVQIPVHDNISLSGTVSSYQRTAENAQEYYQTQSGFDLKFVFPFK